MFHAAKENQGQVLKRLLGSAEGRDLIEVTDQFDNLPIHVAAKGQLISKCPFGVKTSSKKNKNFFQDFCTSL